LHRKRTKRKKHGHFRKESSLFNIVIYVIRNNCIRKGEGVNNRYEDIVRAGIGFLICPKLPGNVTNVT